MHNTNLDYKARLIDLGLSCTFLIEQLNYYEAYIRLKPAMQFYQYPLVVDASWQLMFFSSSKTVSDYFLQEYKEATDNVGAALVHYASWAGNVDALNWFKMNSPEQLVKRDSKGRNASHYAAMSGCTKALDWFKANYPEQLLERSYGNVTHGHYIALSGSADALTWMQAHYPQQLLIRDSNGISPAFKAAWIGFTQTLDWFYRNYPHEFLKRDNSGNVPGYYAALSGSVEALTWFENNYPEQLLETNKYGYNITHYAAASGSTQQLQIVLSRYHSPNQFSFINMNKKLLEKSITCLLELLKTNYSITKVTNLSLVNSERKKLIETYLERNKAIKETKMRFIPFTQLSDHHHELTPELKMQVLNYLLPEGVNEKTIYHSLLPQQRILFILKNTLRESVKSGHDIKALNKLVNEVDAMQESLDAEALLHQIELFEKELQAGQKNHFFKVTLAPNQLTCLSLIKAILTKEDSCQANLN
ncbi:ankyrin repeat domain-containing protein [Legionella gresilensis]|uniref:ankyrin repeat domain-containing protein n=1 Tax=Legionella gresilensis TaxID=91823 RepID=UPI00104111E0|nr:ankyrin repeat domain-containing protein [Legionella gresilensis]